jgi:DNA-directed RNA polymerase subunit M
MQFCGKCGARLKLKQIRTEGKPFPGLACDRCGFYIRIESVTTKPKESATSNIKVLGDEASEIKTLPITTIECPKCGNMGAYWWFLQTRGGDEPATQFYRCTNEKCNHTWRLYT